MQPAVADDFLDAEESDGEDAADPTAYSYNDLAAAFEDDGSSGDEDEAEEAASDSDGDEAQGKEEAEGAPGALMAVRVGCIHASFCILVVVTACLSAACRWWRHVRRGLGG